MHRFGTGVSPRGRRAAIAVCLLLASPLAGAGVLLAEGTLGTDGNPLIINPAGQAEWADATMRWDVHFDVDTGLYDYRYVFQKSKTDTKAISHLTIEASLDFNANYTTCNLLTQSGTRASDDAVASVGSWSDPCAAGYDGSSAGVLGSGADGVAGAELYGLKLDSTSTIFGDDGSETDFDTYLLELAFQTDIAPVWGDFFAKDGRDGKQLVYAVNPGYFLADPAVDGCAVTTANALACASGFLAVPDSASDGGGGTGVAAVPEPGVLVLLGAGLLGLGLVRRRRTG